MAQEMFVSRLRQSSAAAGLLPAGEKICEESLRNPGQLLKVACGPFSPRAKGVAFAR
jgi:hypothetical protein